MNFILEMGLAHIGFSITGESPRAAVQEAIRFIDSQGLPLGKARRIIVSLKVPPRMYLHGLNEVAELIKEEMHEDAEILWNTKAQEETREGEKSKAFLIAGDFE